ncbi:MAG: leucine-rich repeat protein [Treponema sp.]|nr:leucine-rich repeat protein [Treponema sp.]
MRKQITPLKELSLGNEIIDIGDSAFSNTLLENVIIPNSVRHIGVRAFNCENLESAIFEDTSIWYYTSNSSFASGVVIPELDIADASIAADYLKATYVDKYFYKN